MRSNIPSSSSYPYMKLYIHILINIYVINWLTHICFQLKHWEWKWNISPLDHKACICRYIPRFCEWMKTHVHIPSFVFSDIQCMMHVSMYFVRYCILHTYRKQRAFALKWLSLFFFLPIYALWMSVWIALHLTMHSHCTVYTFSSNLQWSQCAVPKYLQIFHFDSQCINLFTVLHFISNIVQHKIPLTI